jgi:hypothetical protein
MAKKKTDPKQLEVEAKQLTAYALRLGGFTLREIAENLGYKSCSGAQKAIEAGQRKLHYDPALDSVMMALDRLETMLKAVWLDAKKGRLGSIDRALKCIQEINRIQGNYQPEGIDITTGGQPVEVKEVRIVGPDSDPDDTD